MFQEGNGQLHQMFQKDQVRQHFKETDLLSKKWKSWVRGDRGQVAKDDGMNGT